MIYYKFINREVNKGKAENLDRPVIAEDVSQVGKDVILPLPKRQKRF
jgi:hypothetical protein